MTFQELMDSCKTIECSKDSIDWWNLPKKSKEEIELEEFATLFAKEKVQKAFFKVVEEML